MGHTPAPLSWEPCPVSTRTTTRLLASRSFTMRFASSSSFYLSIMVMLMMKTINKFK